MSTSARRPLIATIVLLVLVLPLLAVGGFLVRGLVENTFQSARQTRDVRLLSFEFEREQLDEETGLRGFVATRDALLLEPFYAGRASFDGTATRLDAAIAKVGLPEAAAAVADARATNATWQRTIATPLLDHAAADPAQVQRNGKTLVDRFRSDIATIEAGLGRRDDQLDRESRQAIDRITLLFGTAVGIIGLIGILFLVQQMRLASRLESERVRAEDERRRSAELAAAYAAEKRIADTLQEAFSQRPLPSLPMLRFSAMYVPATEEAKVGGDWYDVLELPRERVLFAIGDVAGHGLDAAVGMSRARQALITSALLDEDPASVLSRVNGELLRDGAPMVTAVAGFADSSAYQFVYASAGHPPPLLIEPGRKPRLLDCGDLPLATMSTAQYQTYHVQTVPGAILVLYTDGAVEHSRDVLAGEAMLLEAAARCAENPAVDPATAIHRAIFDGRPAGDDVAILTIGFESDRAAGLSFSAEQGQSSFAGHLGRVTDTSANPVAKRRAFGTVVPFPSLSPKRKAS